MLIGLGSAVISGVIREDLKMWKVGESGSAARC